VQSRVFIQWSGRRAIKDEDTLILACSVPAELRGKRVMSAHLSWAGEHDCPSDTSIDVNLVGYQTAIPQAFRPEDEWQLVGSIDLTPWVRGFPLNNQVTLCIRDAFGYDSGILYEATLSVDVDCGFLRGGKTYGISDAQIGTSRVESKRKHK
jgi:hypothetical protein